jgi:hypothetical protein
MCGDFTYLSALQLETRLDIRNVNSDSVTKLSNKCGKRLYIHNFLPCIFQVPYQRTVLRSHLRLRLPGDFRAIISHRLAATGMFVSTNTLLAVDTITFPFVLLSVSGKISGRAHADFLKSWLNLEDTRFWTGHVGMNGPQARIREVESKDTPLPSSILSGALKNLLWLIYVTWPARTAISLDEV